jgi:hypothetical protein
LWLVVAAEISVELTPLVVVEALAGCSQLLGKQSPP